MEHLKQYEIYLRQVERSEHTVAKYLRDIGRFLRFLETDGVSKQGVLDYKEHLVTTYAPASVNSMLAAVNGYLGWRGLGQYQVKPLKIQRDIFSKPEKELSQREYQRLIEAAEGRNNHQLALVIQTICATGIRVSELQYITVTALSTRRTTVTCKGKTRKFFCPRRCVAV